MHEHAHTYFEYGGIALMGVMVGAIVGGALVGAYRALDEDRDLPKWVDLLAIGCGHGLAIVTASLAGRYVAPDLPGISERIAVVVCGVSALAGPGLWPGIRSRGMALIDSRLPK